MLLNPDIALALGLLFMGLAVPSLMSALADGRRPVVALVLIAGGAVFLWDALQNGGRSLSDAPNAVFTLVGRIY